MTKKEWTILYTMYIAIMLVVIGYIYISYKSNQLAENATAIESSDAAEEIVATMEVAENKETTAEVVDTIKTTETTRIENSITIETETDKGVDTEQAVQPISLGEFKLTAYCSCKKCCGKWALNRPVDENGKEIIYGSIGERLTANYSIAVDPTVIPYRSEVIINGHTYKAQDCGGAIKGNRIDVYFENHEDAWDFGVQYAEVFIIPK